jgi:hypothetical protein
MATANKAIKFAPYGHRMLASMRLMAVIQDLSYNRDKATS